MPIKEDRYKLAGQWDVTLPVHVTKQCALNGVRGYCEQECSVVLRKISVVNLKFSNSSLSGGKQSHF